jgi:hypothetical protein
LYARRSRAHHQHFSRDGNVNNDSGKIVSIRGARRVESSSPTIILELPQRVGRRVAIGAKVKTFGTPRACLGTGAPAI